MSESDNSGALRIEHVHKQVSERQDSITIGSPTNGQVKVYGDAAQAKAARRIILADRLCREANATCQA